MSSGGYKNSCRNTLFTVGGRLWAYHHEGGYKKMTKNLNLTLL